MDILLWLLLVLGVYSYTIYPGLLALAARLFPRPWSRSDVRPSITVIVSVHNEDAVIADKVANALALEYPADRLDVIVSSDGSSDRTDEIVRGLAGPRVTLLAVPGRLGKTACLNRAVQLARGEILIFTDANAMFPPRLAANVARNFATAAIGLVSGWTHYRSAGSESGSAGLYTALEHHTKDWESRIASCVGADGAICAMRRALYQPLEPRDINDFVLPLQVVRQGARAVLDPEVTCDEERREDERKEFTRQLRITTRTLGALGRNMDLLNPFRTGAFALFLLSHKVLRFLAPFFMLGALAANVAVVAAVRAPVYRVLLAGQLMILGMGLLGVAGWRGNRLVRLSAFLLVTLSAQLVAWFRALAGVSDTVWTPQR